MLFRSFRLNGEVLSLTEDLELPELGEVIVDLDDVFTMAPHSLAFWILPNTTVEACN